LLVAIKEVGGFTLSNKKYIYEFLIPERGFALSNEAKDVLERIVESIKNCKHVLFIKLKKQGDWKYDRVGVEEYKESEKVKYLLKMPNRKGNSYNNFSPTVKFTNKTDKVLDKLIGWFEVVLGYKKEKKSLKFSITDEERVFLENIYKELTSNKKKIIDEIKENIDEINRQKKKHELRGTALLSLKFVDGEESYIGDLDLFKKSLIEYVQQKELEGMARGEKVCSLCGGKKEVRTGNGIYRFYTNDKAGYIAGGFDEKQAWRNFPVCLACRESLAEGKKYVEDKLTFEFCNLDYQLIPKTMFGHSRDSCTLQEILEILESFQKDVKLRKREINQITNDEDEIFELISEQDDVMMLDFLFLIKENNAERILLHVEDVLPSRLKTIFNAKKKVDKAWGILLGNKEFNMDCVRTFLNKSDDKKKKQGDLDKYFLEITSSIFNANSVDFRFLLRFVMLKVRNRFNNNKDIRSEIRDGILMLAFLQELALIKMEVTDVEESKFEQFFEKFGDAMRDPLKRGLFLLGSLTKLLLNKQWKELGNDPFRKVLKGLKMQEKDFKGLLPKVQNKLCEYDSFDKGKQLLAKEISNYLLIAGDNWRLSVDEMNFYFAVGMNLTDEITKMIYPEKKEENESEQQ